MFVTHYASGLAFHSRTKGSKDTFFILVLGTQVADLLWGLFTVFGIEGGLSGGSVEHNYFDIPWSHSLLMIIIWSIIYGFLTQLYLKKKGMELPKLERYAAISVFSHWLFDFPVHNDDMMLFPIGDTKVPTLFLWQYPILTFILEIVLVAVFWYIYWNTLDVEMKSSNSKPIIIPIFLIVFHIISYLPTFTNVDPMESGVATGFTVMLMIVGIALIMTWLHPKDKV